MDGHFCMLGAIHDKAAKADLQTGPKVYTLYKNPSQSVHHVLS